MDATYLVAVIGGACAGSEIAQLLVKSGMEVVVFDQNPLPYGKIEDGLPRWHHKMQAKECHTVDQKLDQEGISFMPLCRLGKDLTPENLIATWGFDLVILANGAWRDRSLQIEGADGVTDGSLAYQNAFVYWFNHYLDRNYEGPKFVVPPGAAVLGGGLASLDVVKILQFEVVKNALAERGLSCDLVEMDHKGVHATLEEHGLTLEGLGLAPAQLFYRKRISDMPLVPLGDDPTPDKLDKAEKTRIKLMGNAVHKHGFVVQELHDPVAIHAEDGQLKAMSFAKVVVEDGRFRRTDEVVRYEVPFLVSSIGSLPEPLEGLPMDGELYRWSDRFTGQVEGMDRFYCVGNAITGRGNIKESSANAHRLGLVLQAGVAGEEPDYTALFRAHEEEAREHVNRLLERLRSWPKPTPERCAQLRERVRAYHEEIGYESYRDWREKQLSLR